MKSLLFTVKFGSLLKNFTKNVHIKQLKYSVNFNDKNNFPKLETMKVLNVAEKNDAAKNIAGLLGRGNCQRVRAISIFVYTYYSIILTQHLSFIKIIIIMILKKVMFI